MNDMYRAFEKRGVRGETYPDTGNIDSSKALAVLREQCLNFLICYAIIHQRQIGGGWRYATSFECSRCATSDERSEFISRYSIRVENSPIG